MSTFSESLRSTQAEVAALLAFRAAPSGMVTIRDVGGVWRVTGRTNNVGHVSCVKQSETPIKRAAGAAALPNDRGPDHYFDTARLYPVGCRIAK